MIPLFSAPFLFLRHGETDANAADLIGGTQDLPLNATGHAQARRAAEILAGQGLAAIWCSPLRRAYQTAAAVAERTGLALQIVEGLGERDWGDWEGRPRAALIRDATPPGGESPESFRRRTLAALAGIAPPFPVLVVAHSGTARVIAAELAVSATLRAGNAEPVLWRPEPDGWWRHPL